MAVDPIFGVDNFNNPAVLQEDETLVNNILTVLFGKPGFYPSIPALGMDVTQYLYSFRDDLDTTSLLARLIYQCPDLDDAVSDGSLDCKYFMYQGRPILGFTLPNITKNGGTLTLVVTTNDLGQPKYNFVFNKVQSL